MPPTPQLTVSEIDALINQGLNFSEIAELHGMTRQAVSDYYRRNGGKQPARPPQQLAALAQFPWKVPAQMATAGVLRYLRIHGEYMITGGRGMDELKLKRLHGWYKKLRKDNVVVEFDPTFPAERGVSPHGGFKYQARLDSDGDRLIRVNDFTKWTPARESMWVFPLRDPIEILKDSEVDI